MQEIKGDLCHELLAKNTKQALAFDGNQNYGEWKELVCDKLLELVGMDKIAANACPLNVTVEKEEQKDGYKQIRFVFESEKGAFVPCYLLVPDTGKEKYPVAITLQGHSSGFHNSIGEPKNETENEYALGRGQFAVQAVKQGYATLAIEQRAMGERTTSRHSFAAVMCTFPALTAFQLGRTVLGERMWDVSKAIDALSNFPVCDTEKILITGNSGGGTMSFYAACFDERIKLSVPSCAFCSYETSIMNIYHCACNYIPHAYEWFEMQDLSCLIAPRRLAIVAGKDDPIFPIGGVETAYATVEKIFEKAGVSENCRLVKTPKAHWWCEDIIWNTVKEETEKLGW
ncbi:MAG: acetylxylan esterase [Clostridia bacterium]|nr:acetylxylan esterase [Clostridia bacterium]